MGKQQSKEQEQSTIGDQTVTIIENQEVHTGQHEHHNLKLNIILILLTMQTIIVIVKLATKLMKKAMSKAAQKVFVQQV